MRIAALVKQIPAFAEMALGPDGRLRRDGVVLEMGAYCRRAVAKAVELAAATGGHCTVFTLGPASAEDCLREAVAWGADAGILISDPAFAGSDTLATARALATALTREGPFDLILAGRNSVDADTGQVGPQVAELLDLAFLTGVKKLELEVDGIRAGCEHDDGWFEARANFPLLISVAERLCAPCKKTPEERAAVDPSKIVALDAATLGAGPWGSAGSPTSVGEIRAVTSERRCEVLAGPLTQQAADALDRLGRAGAFEADAGEDLPVVAARADGGEAPTEREHAVVAVLAEPGRAAMTAELCGAAAALALPLGGSVCALMSEPVEAARLGGWGADGGVVFEGDCLEEDIARAVAIWAATTQPWAILAPSTAWGREVAARVAARIGAGLTGDAAELELRDRRLIAWKPAFGGTLVAAISASTQTQMATLRPGALPKRRPRQAVASIECVTVRPRGRIEPLGRQREDDIDTLADARAILCLGQGVAPQDYAALEPLRAALGAEFAATRKVTDHGWMPHARQIGITGRGVAPRLLVSIGASGKYTHSVGLRGAGTVLAINTDAEAPIFDCCDIGIVGDWRQVVPLLVAAIEARASAVTECA